MASASASGRWPELVFAGDSVLYVYFPNRIERAVNRAVLSLVRGLRARAHAGITELVPAYRSLMITFDPLALSDDDLVALVRQALSESHAGGEEQSLVTVPVHYGGDEHGPDLPVVARHTGLTPDEVIALHSQTEYDVFFVGFTPGFPFLGGLPPRLTTPRRAQPRLRVEAGSVAIAGGQTGIYPLPSPGGWQVIGRTPLPLWDPRPEATHPFLLQPGQRLRFEPIDAEAFARLTAQAHARSGEVEAGANDGG